MLAVLISVLLTLRDCVRARAALHVELLALRHQVHVIARSRPLRVIVKPETVIAWHRRGFRRFWAWRSRRLGRPSVAQEVRALIRTMSEANPLL